jgi:uncharacterized Zn-binding protein involved in type VI secretion
MPAAHRLGDMSKVPSDAHGCMACPHASAIGPGIIGSNNVNINGLPARRLGDKGIHAVCCGPNIYFAAAGSGTVNINNIPAHRTGDATAHCGGNGSAQAGSGNVNIGG